MTPGGLCFKCQSWVGVASYAAKGTPLSAGGGYDYANRRFACFACDPEFAARYAEERRVHGLHGLGIGKDTADIERRLRDRLRRDAEQRCEPWRQRRRR